MRLFACAAVIFFASMGSAAGAPTTEAAREIIRHGTVSVTEQNLRDYVRMAVPPEQQAAVWQNRKKLEEYVFGLFATNELAEQARARRLTAREQRIMDDAENRLLSRLQIDYLYENAKKPDFEKLAREIYKIRQEEFIRPEQVSVEHILIGAKGRPDDEARERAEQVLQLVKAGTKSFADLVAEYSDDPSAEKNKGELGFFARGRMVKSFEDAAFALEKPGDVAGPVKTNYGYHVLRLIERRAAAPIPFEEVRDRLVKAEIDRFRKDMVDDELGRLKNLDGVEFDRDAFERLIENAEIETR